MATAPKAPSNDGKKKVPQVKDILALASEHGREKGYKGRRFRRFVEREFDKLMKKKVTNMKFGRGTWMLEWNEKGGVKNVKFQSNSAATKKPPPAQLELPKAEEKKESASTPKE